MPISSTIDYIPVLDQFIAHWNATDHTLIIAEDGNAISVEDLETVRADLDGAKSMLQAALNDLENSRVVLEQTRETAGDRIAEFNRRIRADFPDNTIFNKLPDVPNRAGGRDAFMDPMDDVLDLWAKANALPATPLFTAPLRLPGGFTRDNFAAVRVALDAAFTTRGARERTADDRRLVRNNLQVRAKSLMVTYRLKIEALYAPGSTPVVTLPRLTPLPGSTPDPVTLSGDWSVPNQRAEISWTESLDPDLAGYQVRITPGPEYSAEDETLVASIAPGAPRIFNSAAGLALPGSTVTYKVYVMKNTGHTAGSNAESVTRPA